MRYRKFILAVLLALPVALQAQMTIPAERQAMGMSSTVADEWMYYMRTRLEGLMSDNLLQTTQVGIMVYDLTTHEVVFTRNERQRMRPASVMKLVTSITALDQLGGDYGYHTSICYKGRLEGDTLLGNLYCVGGFDPTITRDDVRMMANDVRQFGISRIDGMIVADVSMKDTLSYGSGWCWDDDNDRLTPLLVDKKDQFLYVLMSEMRSKGIDLSVTLGRGKVPQGCTEIARYTTNIDKVLTRMMKKSDNLYAESMFYQIAAANSMSAGKASDASGQVKRLLTRLGLDPVNYTIADGSGLSLYSYVSAEMIVRLLRHAYDNREIFDHLYPALPIAGVDGTLENRMKTGPCRGNVHAKTGTVSGVSTLGGYCTASNGHMLCFAILNQGVVKASDGRAFQDKMCEALCR